MVSERLVLVLPAVLWMTDHQPDPDAAILKPHADGRRLVAVEQLQHRLLQALRGGCLLVIQISVDLGNLVAQPAARRWPLTEGKGAGVTGCAPGRLRSQLTLQLVQLRSIRHAICARAWALGLALKARARRLVKAPDLRGRQLHIITAKPGRLLACALAPCRHRAACRLGYSRRRDLRVLKEGWVSSWLLRGRLLISRLLRGRLLCGRLLCGWLLCSDERRYGRV